ncbi:VWA domain-containing protein [Pseudomonas sp. CAN2814]|uniref:vWA domain-containing protein n=1 Tax=Pseudomonas sp. CAN1 TaxID=3046726 RepID=UPI002647396A|nr:VWA domain-containing protein [Pseudomonas sp. CAN1]MDN6856776.1 VWA domain-containing protein [Pseudomonas sp. CAN1]
MNTPFDPSKFTAPKAKPLPVILLLDVSGSMGGEKIQNLNDAVRDMLDVFRGNETSETEIWVSIITFGSEVTLHQPLASANDIQWQALAAGGMTPLGVALEMAKAMIEDKDVVPSRAYRPTVVLVSDGQPDNGWKGALREFVNEGRSAKCDRMAMAIGADADEAVLGAFIEDTQNPLFYAENARQMKDFFKFVTMSVTIRTRSQTPNTIPPASLIDVQPATIGARQEPMVATAPDADDGGYW